MRTLSDSCSRARTRWHSPGNDLRAAFADYTSYRMEGGVRYHVRPGAPGRPYVSARAGFRRVEAIPGRFRVPAAGSKPAFAGR